MNIRLDIKKAWTFLKEDSWSSWIVSLILIVLFIKLAFFPVLSLIFGSPLPLVIVESCSMYHDSSFAEWWAGNEAYYSQFGISKSDFQDYRFKNGLNKGDIIIVWGKSEYKKGDIIIFRANQNSLQKNPIIHRVIEEKDGSVGTKGDNNPNQLKSGDPGNLGNIDETAIGSSQILGKAVGKIPFLGWIKLIFFEYSRPEYSKNMCS